MVKTPSGVAYGPHRDIPIELGHYDGKVSLLRQVVAADAIPIVLSPTAVQGPMRTHLVAFQPAAVATGSFLQVTQCGVGACIGIAHIAISLENYSVSQANGTVCLKLSTFFCEADVAFDYTSDVFF